MGSLRTLQRPGILERRSCEQKPELVARFIRTDGSCGPAAARPSRHYPYYLWAFAQTPNRLRDFLAHQFNRIDALALNSHSCIDCVCYIGTGERPNPNAKLRAGALQHIEDKRKDDSTK